MRYNTTTAFAAAEQAWKDAYAKHDVFAEAGDDDSDAAKAASEAEYATLAAFVRFPATTANEIGRKLALITSSRFDGWDNEQEMAQIQRDLLNLSRPALSPEIAAAVTVYLTRLAVEAEAGTKDEDRAHAARCEAFRHLVHLPCFTPGDFLAKAYANLLDDSGGTNVPSAADGSPFELAPQTGEDETNERGQLYLEAEAKIAMRRDLLDCDLGRCLHGLGRVDFDAEAWLALADRADADVSVIVQADGSRGLYVGDSMEEPHGLRDERFNTLLALYSFDHEERIRLIIEAIAEKRPHRVLHAEGAAAVAETVAEPAE